MTIAVIGMGGNIGEPEKALPEAVLRICALDSVSFRTVSSLYRTEPIDSSGPDYLNAILVIETEMGARALLTELLRIENELGRVRPAGVHNAPRTVDLDLLLYGEEVSDDPFVILPHPRMTERAFVLVPLNEAAPQCKITAKTKAADYLADVKDQRIQKYKSPKQWLNLNGECTHGRKQNPKAG